MPDRVYPRLFTAADEATAERGQGWKWFARVVAVPAYLAGWCFEVMRNSFHGGRSSA